MKLERFLTPHAKMNSTWIKDLKIKLDAVKLLEENTGRTLSDVNCSNIFSDPPPRVMTIKIKKINKGEIIKLKSFCTAKETLNKMKRQPTECKKIFANEATDKGLISKIDKPLLQLNKKKAHFKKWQKIQTDNSPKNTYRCQKTYGKCSILLIIREM